MNSFAFHRVFSLFVLVAGCSSESTLDPADYGDTPARRALFDVVLETSNYNDVRGLWGFDSSVPAVSTRWQITDAEVVRAVRCDDGNGGYAYASVSAPASVDVSRGIVTAERDAVAEAFGLSKGSCVASIARGPYVYTSDAPRVTGGHFVDPNGNTASWTKFQDAR